MILRTCVGCISTFNCFTSSPKKFCSRSCFAEVLKQRYQDNPELKLSISKVHKGKKLSDNHKKILSDKMIGNTRGRDFSVEIRKKIGQKSSEKFTDEYKNKQKKTRVQSGFWLSDALKSDYKIYRIFSAWDSYLWHLAEDKQIKALGVFNSKTNRNGLVRDHKLSCKEGFMAGIFPEILKHPVNCDILTHSDNSSKRDKSSITIDQLFEAIINFTGSYKHQEQILLLITYWRKGERFCANKYRRASGE